MTSKILDGRIVRDQIAQKLKAEISRLRSKPKLVIIQVGDLPESNTYIRQKILFGQKIGAIVDHQKLPENISQKNLQTTISKLNTDPSVTGIIVQMPIPKSLDKNQIIDSINPQKDVDGLTSINLKLLWENRKEGHIPATTKGILTLLDYYKIPIAGKHVVVVGRSFLVGKPTALAFLNRDATVTITHSKSKNLPSITKTADILVVATGKAKLISRNHVSSGQVVVDVGINVINDKPSFAKATDGKPETEPIGRKLVGDVDFDTVKNIVAAISPVPGGVGPMTVASLFENLLETYKSQT